MFAAWPDVAGRVVRRLRAHGVERMNAEDLASEAVTRALANDVTFESPEHFFNWTMLVAKNLYYDQRRAESRAPALCTIEDVDVASGHDTPTVVEHRIRLERVLDVLGRMSADDRHAVLSDSTPANRKDAVRLNVRRHRARARLRAALAGLAGLLGLRRVRGPAAALVPVAFVSVLAMIGLPFVGGDHGFVPRPPEAVRLDAARPPVVRVSLAPRAARRPAQRPVRAGTGGAGGAAHQAAGAPPAPKQHGVAKVGAGPVQSTTRVRDNGVDEHLVCVDDVPTMGRVCAGRPIV